MKTKNITFLQFVFLLQGMQLGMGVLSLPSLLAEKAGTDGWISILIAWIINIVFGILIVLVMRQYPEDTLPDLLVRLFGRIVGKLLLLLVILHFALFCWSILASTVVFIKTWFLPYTAPVFLILLFAIPTYMIAGKDLQIVGRYCEVVFYLTIGMSLIALIPLKDSYFIHLLPVLKMGWLPILKSVPTTTYSFMGYEILYLIYPYLRRKDLAVQGVVMANTITMLIYLFITLICFAYFSPDEIMQYNQPTLNLLRIIEFRFLERLDLIYLAGYLFIVSTAWIPYTYGVAFSASKFLGRPSHRPFVVLFIIVTALLIYQTIPSWNQTELWTRWAVRLGSMIVYILPVFLLMYIGLYRLFFRGKQI